VKEGTFVCDAEPPPSVSDIVGVFPVHQYVAQNSDICQLAMSQDLCENLDPVVTKSHSIGITILQLLFFLVR